VVVGWLLDGAPRGPNQFKRKNPPMAVFESAIRGSLYLIII
jgi:hypothetical protein